MNFIMSLLPAPIQCLTCIGRQRWKLQKWLLSVAMLLFHLPPASIGSPRFTDLLTTQPVVIVVRDSVGTPLMGVSLLMFENGPPLTAHDQCVTDRQGDCLFDLLPGSYALQFAQGWRGQLFIPPEEQNAGGVSDGGSSSGFLLNISSGNTITIFTFVVVQKDNLLFPVWDLSRDTGAVPDLYFPETGSDRPPPGIDLSPIAVDDQNNSTLPHSEEIATPMLMIVQDVIRANNEVSDVPTKPSQTGTNEESLLTTANQPTGRIVLSGLIALLIVLTVFAASLWWLKRQGQRSQEAEDG